MPKHLSTPKILSILLFQIVFLVSFTANASELFNPWEDYKKQKQAGTVANLVSHIQNLYTLPEGVSLDEMQHRQRAILYFLATGGKNGFRKTPATADERIVLENALLFAGMAIAMDSSGWPNDELRRAHTFFSQKDADEKEETHLAIATRYFVMGRLIGRCGMTPDPHYVKMILSYGYVFPRLRQEFSKNRQGEELEAEIKKFSSHITPSITNRVIGLWDKMPKPEGNSYIRSTKPPLKAEDIDALKAVLGRIQNITRDTLAFKMPITSYMIQPNTGHSSSIIQGSRPMIAVLKNGVMVIRLADRTLTGQNTFMMGKDGELYLDDLDRSVVVRPDQTNEEILAILNKFSPIVHQFYYGNEEDFDGLSLADVWPEPYVVVPRVYAPPSRETPNTDLMRQTKEESLQACHDCIEKLKLPAYMSRFVDNEGCVKTLTQVIEKLEKINVLEENLGRYADFLGSLDSSLNFAMMSLSSPMMCRLSDDYSPSRTHGDSILEIFFNALKTARSGIQKILHLSKPFAARMYPPKEDFKMEDIPSGALPSKGVIEEGEAEIRVTDAVMDIFAKTDFTVITFENFWIGSNAVVRLHLPSDDAIISLYHKSARPSFTLGKFERDEKWHVNIYTPEQQRGTDVCGRLKRAGGIYQPKNTRRYPFDLGYFHDSLKHKTFDEHEYRKPNTALPVNFMETPDGRFEMEFIAFEKKKKEDGSYSMEDLQSFLPVCERYKRERVTFASETAGAIQNNIANALYLKSQTLPLSEQGPLLKESADFFEKASRSGHRNADSQVEKLKTLYAQWFYKMGEEKSEENFDQAVAYFRQAICMIEPLSEADVEIGRNNFGCALIKKVSTMITSPSLDFAQAKKFLDEADELLTKVKKNNLAASENKKDIAWFRNALGFKLVEQAKPLMQDLSKDIEVLALLDEAEELFTKSRRDCPHAETNLASVTVIKALLQQRVRGSN